MTAEEASLGQLIPWPDDEHFPSIDPADALDLYLGWLEAQGIEPWDHQTEALLDVAAGDHVILGTPTGSGKSLVAEGMCFVSVCTDRRAVWTAPIKALVSEKFFQLVEAFGRENVGMLTGDVVINPEAPVVCCTAEILAQDALRQGAGLDVGCVIMDEFHYLGDRDRGWAWLVPLLALPNVQFLLMSATLGDVSAIAAGLEGRTGRQVSCVLDAPRPVPLAYEFVDTPLEATVELALRDGDAPIYIVHFAQADAVRSAQALASYGVSSKEQREEVKEAIRGQRFNTGFGKTLKRLLLCGVGVHHAGMLPRYRLLVEKLAQQGLLPVICGTDTLGVGINVPIHTVILNQLAKFDGRHARRLNAREFHQIAGRAGRAGYDVEGRVICEATEFDIDRARALAKAGGDPKKMRKVRAKTPPKGFVGWNKSTMERLVEADPEPLRPHMRVTSAMVLAEVEQGGDAWSRMRELVEAGTEAGERRDRLLARVDELFATLIDAGVVSRTDGPDGSATYATTVEMPDDLALDQPLSPFLLAALELLDPESPDYALDLISMAEATLEDPVQILRAQEHEARSAAIARMKEEGVDYEERIERAQEVTYPKPLEEELGQAFAMYCEKVPWAADYELRPKSVLRDMVETASDFRTYVGRYGIARSEGTLLRYLSDAYRVLDRTVPADKLDDRLRDIVDWLRIVVRTTDSSLVDEWEHAGEPAEEAGAAPQAADEVVRDRHGLTLLVRNALFARVRLAALGRTAELGALDADWGWREAAWQQALDAYHDAHEEVLLDADARSAAYLDIDEADEDATHVWHVHQAFRDEDDDRDFGIWADVDLDATQEEGTAVFKSYRVGFFEDAAR
ncbi:MAG: DUF3516 domain-containing protein [Atopobiaceae bacterium]|jgi:superfamily II RNA helicase|nr:DUF3516 domain-containing protein [Atopobiaceae bacterium]MCH4119956.1 DUF3516 domain-containing protein [Atopobiaceae bacterium]MCI1318570.1 DUF3516 domain-containing protein [Atopobiaceae bacterium]MCI1389316.1 DUF3516 domain-containing protein [Atopobiaceae bacterium]MCI1432379.1 DUF3516 domain-containing protein [Atopobiaceae bacterium]